MAKKNTPEEREIIKLIEKLPLESENKKAWVEQIDDRGLDEEIIETIRSYLLNDSSEGPNIPNRLQYSVQLTNIIRRWRLSNQAHGLGKQHR